MPISLLEQRPWLRNLDYKLPWTITYPKVPAYQLLRDTTRQQPDKAATSFYDSELTFWELYRESTRMANALIELGVKKEDRVGLMLPNCPQFTISFFAILMAGGVVVNMNPMYTLPELKHCVDVTDLAVLFTFDAMVPMVKSLKQEVNISTVIVTRLSDYINGMPKATAAEIGIENEEGWFHFSTLMEESTNIVEPGLPVKYDDPALIQFTGGTTGSPKGACLTHYNLVSAAILPVMAGESMLGSIEVPRRTVLLVIPMFHAYGEICGLMYGVQCCATTIMLPNFNIDEVVATIEKWPEITFWPAVPTMLTALVNHPKADQLELGKKIKYINTGAAPCTMELLEKCRRLGLYVSEAWAMSETCSVGIANPSSGAKKFMSIGIPLSDFDIRIVDADTGEDVKLGDLGEIWIKGPSVMKEYWNNPEETAQAFTEDGWLRTGDIAYQDEDYYIFIVDRTKDVIITGGFNVYPKEIDEVLLSHPQVTDAMTVGIPHEYQGETVKAFIQLNKGAEVTAQEIIDFCKQQLVAYKVPRLIEFRSELPRNFSGKALRRLLRDEELAKKGE